MTELTITAICELLESRGSEPLERSPVTLLQHALQTAWLAETTGASASLVAACLLHDLGHLFAESGDARPAHGHDTSAAARLTGLFGAAVVDPIRLHISAKRYLCYADAGYRQTLPASAGRSLARQGGAFTGEEARRFLQEPHAREAVSLRRWDDQAHRPAAATPSLAHFAATLRICAIPKHRRSERPAWS
jgi:predicted HD phosphohydrolase